MCSSLLTGTVYNSSHNKLPVQLKTVQVNYSSTSEKCHVLQSNTGEESWSVPTFIDKVKKKKKKISHLFLNAVIPVDHLINTRSTPALHDLWAPTTECIHAQKLVWAATVWKLQLLLSKVPRNVHLNAKSSAKQVNLFLSQIHIVQKFLRYR